MTTDTDENVSPLEASTDPVFSKVVATTAKELEAVVNPKNVFVLGYKHLFTHFLHENFDAVLAMVSIKGGGYHWIAIVPSYLPTVVSVFDSYGLNTVNNEFYDIRQVIPPKFSVTKLDKKYNGFQSPGSNVCGEYCVIFTELANCDINSMYRLGFENINGGKLVKNHTITDTSKANDDLALDLFKNLADYKNVHNRFTQSQRNDDSNE